MGTMIVKFCDQHQQNDETIGGDTWEVTISPPNEKASAFEVDLCPDCSKPLLDIIEHFGEIARSVKAPATSSSPSQTKGSPIACPDCGDVYADRGKLSSHSRRIHNKTITELLNEKANYVCLACPNKPKFKSGTGFSAHRRAAHDLGVHDPLKAGEVIADPTATALPYGKTGKNLSPT